MDGNGFPEDFAALDCFSEWALPTETARSQWRRDSEFAQLKAFYDEMLPRISDILAHLNEFPLHELPEPQRRLLDLSLAFAEIAPFVEQYRRVILPEVFDERRFVPMHEGGASADERNGRQ